MAAIIPICFVWVGLGLVKGASGEETNGEYEEERNGGCDVGGEVVVVWCGGGEREI